MPFYIMTDKGLGTMEKIGLSSVIFFLEFLIAFMILCAVYASYNWIGLDSHNGHGIITNHQFVKEHRTGKTSYPDSWYVFVQISDDAGDWVQVRQSFYNDTTNGYQLNAKYYIGRLNRKTWITEIYTP